MISAALDFVPILGDVKNFIEAAVGWDLAGRKLATWERTAMAVGAIIGAFTILDEITDAASLMHHAANNLDFAADTLKASKGLGHLDEAEDIARGLDQALLTHVDDLDDAKALRNADELAISNRLDNLDDFTGGRRTADEAAQVRDRLTRNADEGALSRRLDEVQARRQADEIATARRSDEFGVGAACRNSFTAGTLVHTDEGQVPEVTPVM